MLLKIIFDIRKFFKLLFYQLELTEERAIITDFKSYICYEIKNVGQSY